MKKIRIALLALVLVMGAFALRAQNSDTGDPMENFGTDLAPDLTNLASVQSVTVTVQDQTCSGNPITTSGTIDCTWTSGRNMKSKSISVANPTNAENWTMFFTSKAITITKVRGVVQGSGGQSVTYNVVYGTDRTSGTNVSGSPSALTSTTTGADIGTLTNTSVAANSWVWLITTAKAGTVTELAVTVEYTLP